MNYNIPGRLFNRASDKIEPDFSWEKAPSPRARRHERQLAPYLLRRFDNETQLGDLFADREGVAFGR